MHEFYKRMQIVFQRAGSNRNQFCKKYGYNYQTLQAYWNTDKLPSGNVLADLARAYNVSLDMLLLGRSSPESAEDNPIIARITGFLRQLDTESLLRVDGALQMFRYLALSSTSRESESSAPGSTRTGVGMTAEADIFPDKIQTASDLLSDLARRIKNSAMGEEDKKACRDSVSKIIQSIYEREGKDEWADLEEIT